MNAEGTIDELLERLNNSRPAWLHVDAVATEHGQVLLRATVLHSLGVVAANDSPEAVADALADLFDSMAKHVSACCAGGDEHNSQRDALASDCEKR